MKAKAKEIRDARKPVDPEPDDGVEDIRPDDDDEEEWREDIEVAKATDAVHEFVRRWPPGRSKLPLILELRRYAAQLEKWESNNARLKNQMHP